MAGKPVPGGDYGVGHAFALLFSYAGVAIGLCIAWAMVFWKGGFDWVSEENTVRNILVFTGISSILILSFFGAMGNGGGAPWVVRLLGKHTVVWLLPPIFWTTLVLLNPSLRTSLSNTLWQWPIKAVVLLSIVSCLAMIGEWLVNIPIQIAQQSKARVEADNKQKQQFLNDIAQNNAQTSLITILVFTTKYHDPDVRNAALAKIKSNPQWQEYLVERLATPWAPQVFSFMADNEVDNKNFFVKPIELGILEMAKVFEDGMRRTHTFYDGQFYSETEDVLETIAKFEGMGVDYAPAVRKMRAALDTPLDSYQVKANLRCIPVLDQWLKKHEKAR